MTTVVEVSARQMAEQTGLKKALGYALPKEDKILIRKGLSKEQKKKVLAHEEEHIAKGEEGPFWNILLPVVASIGSAVIGSRSAKKASNAQTAAANQDIAFQRESRDLARQDYAPYREAGTTALDALMSMTGLSAPKAQQRQPVGQRGRRLGIDPRNYLAGLGGRKIAARRLGGNIGMDPIQRAGVGWGGPQRLYNVSETAPENVYSGGAVTRPQNPTSISTQQPGYVRPNENPGGMPGGYNFMTDPGYDFRFNEGMRALERGAGAAGGLLSGGFGRRAIRYGQDYASNEYTNVYNRIANIAGLGQVASQNSGQAALYAGTGMGNAAWNAGQARASGYVGQGNAWGTAINDIAKLPWGSVFNPTGSGGTGQTGTWTSGPSGSYDVWGV